MTLAVALGVMPAISHALGLGSIRIKSALNEPLNAEIDFTSVSRKELKGLNVTLAPRAAFDAAGVDRPAYLTEIKFSIAKRLDGRPFVQVTSEQPIREPFIHLLVQAEWLGGRLVREFTALIDPPNVMTASPPAIQVPEVSSPAAEAPVAPSSMASAEQAAPVPAEPLPRAGTRSEQPQPSEPSSPAASGASSEPLGPRQMGEPNVAISPESGWPVATTQKEARPTAAPAGREPPAAAAKAPVTVTGEAAPMPAGGGFQPNWARVARYDVKRGDTLWQIAEDIRVDRGLTIEQVIMALYEANRGAFFNNNVNNVWAGKILVIPQRQEVESLSARAAHKVFVAHYSEWKEYKVKLASASPTLKVPAEPEQPAAPAAQAAVEPETPKHGAAPKTSATAGKPSAKAAKAAPAPKPASKTAETPKTTAEPGQKRQPETPPTATRETAQAHVESAPAESAGATALVTKAQPPAELLKIVRAAIETESVAQKGKAEGGSGDAERLALEQRATTLDEALESKQMQEKDLKERIGTHESQIERQKRLIELNTGGMAAPSAQPPEAKAAKETPTQAETPAQPPEQAAAPAVTEPAKPVKPKAQATPKPQPKAKPAEAAKGTKKRPRRVSPASEPQSEKGLLASLHDMMSAYLMQALAGIVALAGGLILLTYLRRRRAAEAEFEESILTDTDAVTDSATTDSGAPASGSAGSTSFLSDFSQGGMGNISTDEVDPLAETEVYLAYGRDEQAEEILKDAVAKDPSRHELKVKLLEIYHQRNDLAAFETLAEELYAALEGRGGDLWNKVAQMGRKLNPDNPMFQAVMPVDEPSLPESIPTQQTASRAAPAAGLAFAPAAAGTERTPVGAAGLDLDISAEPASSAGSGLDFDLDLEGATAEKPAKEPTFPNTAELSAEDLQAGAAEDESVGLGQQPTDNVLDFDITEGRHAPEPALEQESATSGVDTQWDLETEGAGDLAIETEGDTGGTGEESQQWDETATKLDLAKAYVDMGDAEGARSILDEVLAEGNEDQKRQAAELAAQIA